MRACVDVHYRESEAVAAAVLFEQWDDELPAAEQVAHVSGVAPYEPGSFYRRELPCLLAVIERLAERPRCIVVDGCVWLGAGRPGLGAHLYEALARAVTIVGVAKTPFRGAPSVPVLRGASTRPLHVTAAGMDVAEAADCVRRMHGRHRVPTLLARADRLGRSAP